MNNDQTSLNSSPNLLNPIQPAPNALAINAYYTAMRRFWHPVLPVADLPAYEPVGVELLEEPVVLARLNGEIVAMQDLCRHFQARLSLGEISKIAGAGECVDGHPGVEGEVGVSSPPPRELRERLHLAPRRAAIDRDYAQRHAFEEGLGLPGRHQPRRGVD